MLADAGTPEHTNMLGAPTSSFCVFQLAAIYQCLAEVLRQIDYFSWFTERQLHTEEESDGQQYAVLVSLRAYLSRCWGLQITETCERMYRTPGNSRTEADSRSTPASVL